MHVIRARRESMLSVQFMFSMGSRFRGNDGFEDNT
jgi:hypothetical protein